ncbi:MAG TPA: lytic transglycosylase domain-containing protein [Ktedonobacteraceae bacterium]
MKKNTYVLPTGLTDVRKKRGLSMPARLGTTLAGTGWAGAMLLSGLFSGHASAAARQMGHQANMQAAVVTVRTHTARETMALMSRRTASASYRDIARQAAAANGINPALFERQINQESGFNPWAVSAAGAEGIAQFMPATAASMGVNPWDPVSALWGAARLMAQLSSQFGGNYAMALAAYNAGPGAVHNAINAGGNNWYSYLPAETRNYVRVIMGW